MIFLHLPEAHALVAKQDLPLDGNHVYLGTDGCGVEVIDVHTGQKRMITPVTMPSGPTYSICMRPPYFTRMRGLSSA